MTQITKNLENNELNHKFRFYITKDGSHYIEMTPIDEKSCSELLKDWNFKRNWEPATLFLVKA